MTYSGSATDERYAMGMLTADADGDLLDAKSWRKMPRARDGQRAGKRAVRPRAQQLHQKRKKARISSSFTPGPIPASTAHPLSDPNRHCHIRTVRYDADDKPVFQEREVRGKLRVRQRCAAEKVISLRFLGRYTIVCKARYQKARVRGLFVLRYLLHLFQVFFLFDEGD